jgi:hypothetical protein
MNLFSAHGAQVAQREIQESEDQKEIFGDVKYRDQDLEIKPITVKAMAYEIEALDYIAAKLGGNRSNFVKDLFLTYMVTAVRDYVESYDSHFVDQPILPIAVRDFLELEKSSLPDASKALIESLIVEVCGA